MLDNIDIQYEEFECRVHIVLYPGFFPCNKKSYRMIRNFLKHLPPDVAKDKAAQIALHIEDLRKEAYQSADSRIRGIKALKNVDQQWKYYTEFLLPFLNYDGGCYATTKNL